MAKAPAQLLLSLGSIVLDFTAVDSTEGAGTVALMILFEAPQQQQALPSTTPPGHTDYICRSPCLDLTIKIIMV